MFRLVKDQTADLPQLETKEVKNGANGPDIQNYMEHMEIDLERAPHLRYTMTFKPNTLVDEEALLGSAH